MVKETWKEKLGFYAVIGLVVLLTGGACNGLMYLWYERGPSPNKHDREVMRQIADLHYEHEQVCKCVLCNLPTKDCPSPDPILTERDNLRRLLEYTEEEVNYFEQHPRHYRSEWISNGWECVRESDTCGNPVADYDMEYLFY